MIAALARIFAAVVLFLVGFGTIHATHDLNWAWVGLAVFVASFVIEAIEAPPFWKRTQ